jgi:hypothetical protein
VPSPSHDFLSVWRDYEANDPPFVLTGDEVVLSATNRCGTTADVRLEQYTSSVAFGDQADRSLHLGLCPLPFVGNPSKASIFILMLNPGLSPGDYFAEQQDGFREALWANLKGQSDFLYLNPHYAWHPGFYYWHGKLASVVRELAARASVSYEEALKRAATKICVIELVPYHSISFGLSDRVVRGMRSPVLARQFVHDEVLPRARRGDAAIIVTRQIQQWGLGVESGAIVYEGSETRAAHLGVGSRGGDKILEFLSASGA